MANIAEYFEKNRYQAKYEFGTRVFGKWNKIPFIGTIYNDSVISEEQGPRLTISLDLPITFENKTYERIIDIHKNFKELELLLDYDAPEADRIARASKTRGSGFDSHRAHQKKEKPKTKTQSLLENLKKLQKSTPKKKVKKGK